MQVNGESPEASSCIPGLSSLDFGPIYGCGALCSQGKVAHVPLHMFVVNTSCNVQFVSPKSQSTTGISLLTSTLIQCNILIQGETEC